MKKIMFNDKYGLTEAVLGGRKTMTRRIMNPQPSWVSGDGHIYNDSNPATYKVGEIVAVSQPYKDVFTNGLVNPFVAKAGWTNKMFVRADLMPHQIRITNIRIERLQDISDEDVYKEGFSKEVVNNGWGNAAFHWEAMLVYYDSLGRTKEIQSRYPREAFACLIDRLCGNGTWEDNPYVFVYEFELVK